MIESALYQSWTAEGDYDHPIPRRIVKKYGVDRQMFGQTKRGAGFNYRLDNLNYLNIRMSPTLFDSFSKFYKENKRKGYFVDMVRYGIGEWPVYTNYMLRKSV